jgi:enoyl-CoA hydratase/carnithine racemase
MSSTQMKASTYGKIRVAREGAIETITLCNPERRNAIGPQMTNELLYAIDDAMNAAEVRAVVITGEGKAFSAGGDFAQMNDAVDEASARDVRGDYADLLIALSRAHKPIIAKVNGHAVGGGLGIVAACTFAIASREALFGTPEINVGLFPMMVMAVLGRIVPRRKLLEMMILGDRISADDAMKIGIVGQVTEPNDLEGAVLTLAMKIASKSASTLSLGLKAMAAQDDLPLETALPMLRNRLMECLSTADAQEGLIAFLEKRAPLWTNK